MALSDGILRKHQEVPKSANRLKTFTKLIIQGSGKGPRTA